MTTYEKGDVILVPFPFSNQSELKKRPSVVISSSYHNKVSEDIIIMAITSQRSKSIASNECAIQEWGISGLLKPSYVKAVISTIEQQLVLKKLGKLSSNDLISTNILVALRD